MAMAPVKARRRSASAGVRARLPLFLDVDDCLGLCQAQREAGFVLLQQCAFGRERVGRGALRTARRRCQGRQGADRAQPAPIGQAGGVETLAPQDGADATGIGGTVGFGQDAQLVLNGEGSAAGMVGQFGRRSSGFGTTVGLRRWSVPKPEAASVCGRSMGMSGMILQRPQG
jgi:hypothetical protein